MAVRGLLARVTRLEQARIPTSPFERWYGSLEAFTEGARAGIASGTYDAADMTVLIASVERWHREGAWAR